MITYLKVGDLLTIKPKHGQIVFLRGEKDSTLLLKKGITYSLLILSDSAVDSTAYTRTICFVIGRKVYTSFVSNIMYHAVENSASCFNM